MNKTTESIVAEAMLWLATPYHHQARVKGVGVDCGMLLCEVFEQCGLVPHIDPRPYPADWHLHQPEQKYLAWVLDYCDQVETPQDGDIALFYFGKCISHAGIIVDVENMMMIHAYMKSGVVLQDMKQKSWLRRLAGFYRVKGL